VTNKIALDYHCAAYNCLAAVVMGTQTKENFFHVFLFKESREKNELVWENIVDIEVHPKSNPFPFNFLITFQFREPTNLRLRQISLLQTKLFKV
jgi:NUC194 domain